MVKFNYLKCQFILVNFLPILNNRINLVKVLFKYLKPYT